MRSSYPDKSPGRGPVIVSQMPYEVAHDSAHDQTRQQLRGTNAMEDDARIAGRRGLRAAIEWVQHRPGASTVNPIARAILRRETMGKTLRSHSRSPEN